MNAAALDWKSVYAAMHRDGEAAFPPAALHYVLQLVRRQAQPGEGGKPPETAPASLIAAFRRAARADFGSMSEDVLSDWKLATPADLGRAVLLLGKYRCLSLEPSDTAEAFGTDDRPLHEVP